MRILSVWDRHFSSEKIIESGLRDRGHQVYSVARRLVMDEVSLDPWVSSQKTESLDDQDGTKIYEKFLRLISLLRFLGFVRKRIRLIKPEILICHFGQTGSRFIRMANRLQIPIVILFYGHDISAALTSKRWVRKYAKFSKYPCTLIVMCEEAATRLHEFGCQPEKIKCWNLPINLEAFPFGERTPPIGRVKALTCARFVEKKGYPTLLSAMSILREEGIEVELHALGYGGNFEMLVQLSKKLKIDDLIVWHRDYTGDRSRVKYLELLRNSDVFLIAAERAMNGDDEGGPPLSVISAQATGIPIISTKFTGFEITIEDGKTGFLCSPPVDISMASQVKNFIKNPQPFFAVGVAGAARARQEFDFARQSDKLVKLLHGALTSRP